MPSHFRRGARALRSQVVRPGAVLGLVLAAASAVGAPVEPVRERVTAASVFARADANQDGRLSPSEAARFPAFAERFDRLDADHDGYLSPDEFVVGFNAPL